MARVRRVSSSLLNCKLLEQGDSTVTKSDSRSSSSVVSDEVQACKSSRSVEQLAMIGSPLHAACGFPPYQLLICGKRAQSAWVLNRTRGRC